MAIMKYSNGKLYDSAQNGPDNGMMNGNPVNQVDDFSATVPTQMDFNSFDAPAVGPTTPEENSGFTNAEMYHDNVDEIGATTVQPIDGVNSGADPVVGWLVCVKGPDMGKDYRLHSGTNFIGRSERMDVCIKNDNAISRSAAASISYDDRSRTFFIQKGEVRNLIYLNGRALRADADLSIYDRIEIGNTMLVFVPLCGQQFNWQEV